MQNLTKEEREQIAVEEYHKQPTGSIAHVASLKLAELGINSGAKKVEQNTEATFEGKRYSIKTIVTYKELKNGK